MTAIHAPSVAIPRRGVTRGARVATAASVARHYDELDVFYRDVWGEHVHHGLWVTGRETSAQAVLALVDHVAAAAGIHAGSRVIDVGAGYGATARHLATVHGAEVTAVTVSRAQYEHAVRAPVAPRVRMLLHDWLVGALPPCSADAVIAIESTEHMASLPGALARMREVLRPGGRVAICVWLSSSSSTSWQERWLLRPIAREGRLVTLTSEEGYRRHMLDAGFTHIRFEELTCRVARTWHVCIRRLLWRVLTDARYLRYALHSSNSERAFLATMFRIALAYGTGAMRYGMFVAEAGGSPTATPPRRGHSPDARLPRRSSPRIARRDAHAIGRAPAVHPLPTSSYSP